MSVNYSLKHLSLDQTKLDCTELVWTGVVVWKLTDEDEDLVVRVSEQHGH